MLKEDDYILINRYLDNQLSDTEKSVFEKRLSVEKGLEKELKIVQSMNSFLDHKNNLDFMLAENRKTAKQHKARIIPMYRKNTFRIAAAAILLLLIGSFFLLNRSTSLYRQFAEHRALSIEKSSVEENIGYAVQAYNKGNYERALSFFEEINKTANAKDPEFKLAEGVCYLELNNLDKAEESFRYLIGTEDLYKNEGYWYLALTEIKRDNPKKCREYLKQISKDSSYKAKAEEMLSGLK